VFTDTLSSTSRRRAVAGRPEAPAGPRAAEALPAKFAEGFAKRWNANSKGARRPASAIPVEGANFDLGHGDVVIAAITSCTNTSNPSVLIAAGLLARKAVAPRA
jgi:aconitate hydratase